MWPFSRILCGFGRHHRSRGQARRIEGGWRSRCRRCGKPMVKFGESEWTIEPAAADAAVDDAAVAGASGPIIDGPPRSKWRRWLFARRRNRAAPLAK